MTDKKTCIVCGKPIAKRTITFYLRESVEERPATYRTVAGREILDLPAVTAKPHGTVEGEGFSRTVYLDRLPTDQEECARLTNHEIVSIRRDHQGNIWQFGAWDGNYVDEFFHSQACAAKQGYASAQHGARFVWK